MTSVRQATHDDRDAVLTTVVSAFTGDPAWDFITAGEFDRAAAPFAAALFDSRVDSGHVWVADDGDAVAMWEPPRLGTPAKAPVGEPWLSLRSAVGESVWSALTAYDDAVAAARPSTPYWYLGVLATAPARHGQGLATAVLAPVLESADSSGVDCCLETSTAGNHAFYTRRGFTEATDIVIPGGPPTWWLRRPAAR